MVHCHMCEEPSGSPLTFGAMNHEVCEACYLDMSDAALQQTFLSALLPLRIGE